MTMVRDPQGRSHTQARGMAEALREYWGGGGGGGDGGGVGTETECWQHLRSLPIPLKVAAALPLLPLLIKLLCAEVPQTALVKLKRGSSPGRDRIPAEVYQVFPQVLRAEAAGGDGTVFAGVGGGCRTPEPCLY